MPFGITSSPGPGIFQRVTESLLQGIPHVVVYLDDILIIGKDDEEHLKSLEEVLFRLKKSGLRLKRDKCFFFQKEVEYLGYKIDANGSHQKYQSSGYLFIYLCLFISLLLNQGFSYFNAQL